MDSAAASRSPGRTAVEPHFETLRIELHVSREQFALPCFARVESVALETPAQIVEKIAANPRSAIGLPLVPLRKAHETVDALVHVGGEACEFGDTAEMGQVDGLRPV